MQYRCGESVLHSLFGEIKGPGGADQARDDAAGFVAEDRFDGVVEIIHRPALTKASDGAGGPRPARHPPDNQSEPLRPIPKLRPGSRNRGYRTPPTAPWSRRMGHR